MEAIISIGIAALVLNAFYASVSTNVELKARSQERARAVLLAKSLLDSVSTVSKLERGRTNGSGANGMVWDVDIQPLSTEAVPFLLPAQTPLFTVRVKILDETSTRTLYVLQSIKGAL